MTTSSDPTLPLVEENSLQVRNRLGQLLPGHTANPNGRPSKGHSITETIREMMDAKPEIKAALGNKILQMALSGDIIAMKTIWNYLDGMPKESHDITQQGTMTVIVKREP